MALLRSLATVSGWTAASRVLGFIRDILIARVLGDSAAADAFFVAFRLPNMFRRIFAEGAFNAAFVPLFSRRLEEDGSAAARGFAEEVLSVLLTALLIVSAVMMLAMGWVMHGFAPGFLAHPEKFALAVDLSRFAFPYLLFISLMAFFGGVLNSLLRFKAAAGAPILLNVFLIAALLAIVPFTGMPAHVMAWTVAAAGVAQFLVTAIAARRAGMTLRVRAPHLTPGVRRLVVLMVPGLMSAAVLQINLVIGTVIASFQKGAVSYLYYADRVYQLPLGLIGIAFGIVLLPELSRKLRAGRDAEAMDSFNRGFEFAMLLTLPAAVALVAIAHPIVAVLFGRGAFDRDAGVATAWALAAFAAGLPAYVMIKVLQPGFFAREDMVTPLRYAAVSVAVNVVFSIALFFPLGHIGIALATALAAWVNTALLYVTLSRRGFLTLDGRARRSLPRIALASLVMGAALVVADRAFGDWLDGPTWLGVAILVFLVCGGMAVYGAAAVAVGAASISDVKSMLRRRPKDD